MSLQRYIQTAFNGGFAQNSKSGPPNSAKYVRALDIFSDANAASLLPAASKISASVVVDLPKVMVDGFPYVTDKYAYGDTGHVYKITNSDVVTDDQAITGGAGQGLIVLGDTLFGAASTSIWMKRYLSLGGSYTTDFLSNGTDNVDVSQALTGQTYTLETSVAETAAKRILLSDTLIITKDPLKTVQIWVTAKGTGNWTVMVHDADNNSIGTATVANASLTNGQLNDFTFATPLRIDIGKIYHIHVTSTVADGTVRTGTNADISTATFKTLFGILIADTDYHPFIKHTNGVTGIWVVGNEHYLGTYDLVTYNPNKIELEPGYKVRGFTRENEFIVAYCWKGTEVDDYEEGMMFYWDGITPYYNYKKPITGGQPNAMVNFKNRIFSVLGDRGRLTLGTEPFRKIQGAPLLNRGKKVEVYPNAICIWNDRVHFAYSNTDDSGTISVEQGVYEFGNESDRDVSDEGTSAEVLSLSYALSTGTVQSTSLKVGCLYPEGRGLFIGWKDGSNYGIDKVSKSGNPAAAGLWESLIFDQGIRNKQIAHLPQKTKKAVKLIILCEELPANTTLKAKYRTDRETSFHLSDAAVAGATQCELSFGPGGLRYKEIEIGYELYATGANFPKVTGIYYEFDALEEEAMDQ